MKRSKGWLGGAAFLALLAVLAWWRHGAGPAELLVIQGQGMGSTYDVRIVRPAAGITAEALKPQVEGVMDDVNRSLSIYTADSAISRFNAADSMDWQAIPPELVSAMTLALRLNALSDGAFDVTLGPLIELWGFGMKLGNDQPPAPERIQAALALIGADAVKLDAANGRMRKRHAETRVNLSAISQGWGADRVAALLREQGMADFSVEVGGEVRTHGLNQAGEPWRIAIRRPEQDGAEVQEVIHIGEGGISTSGDYQEFFLHGGKRYSHTLDAKSGHPVTHNLASVTVIRPTAAEADGLSTTFMALGPERGLALAQREGIAAYFILREESGFAVRISDAFKGHLAPR